MDVGVRVLVDVDLHGVTDGPSQLAEHPVRIVDQLLSEIGVVPRMNAGTVALVGVT